jgi:alkyldihydroxyacetonephosphate synthase
VGVVSDTFETAITWDRFDAFVATVRERAEAALAEICGGGTVTCRLTHVYPDGAAPYFTCLAPARRGGEVEQWDEIKAAASEAIIAAGGTITHHHAVGRDHAPWMTDEVGELGVEIIRAAKQRLDPAGIMNPGKLLPDEES